MNVFEVEDGGRRRFYLSPLAPDSIGGTGLRSEAIIGELTDGPEHFDVEHFRPNPLFIEFLHYVLAKHVSSSPGFAAEAARQQDGYVYIIDRRAAPPPAAVAAEDIIGAVEIAGGEALRYTGSPKHQLMTGRGLIQLEDWLHARLIEELRALPG